MKHQKIFFETYDQQIFDAYIYRHGRSPWPHDLLDKVDLDDIATEIFDELYQARIKHHRNDINTYRDVFETKIGEMWSSCYDRSPCPDGFDDHLIEDIENRLFEDHLEQHGLFFDDDVFERYTWFLEDHNLDDSKDNRYLFVDLEVCLGAPYDDETLNYLNIMRSKKTT